jgi:outer membrane protein OmpA-like peptidoglycan-associated protein
MRMRRALLTLFSLVVMSTAAAAQFSVPGMDPNPFPILGLPTQRDEKVDSYRRLPYRDTYTAIRIELAADVLFDFDRAEVRPNAADLLAQTANLIFEHADGPVRIECHSDRVPPAAGQKLAQRCAVAVSQWLITQEKLTKVKFTTVGTSGPPPGAANPNDPFAPKPVSKNNITIDFAKK